jgi:hypothetical protein
MEENTLSKLSSAQAGAERSSAANGVLVGAAWGRPREGQALPYRLMVLRG